MSMMHCRGIRHGFAFVALTAMLFAQAAFALAACEAAQSRARAIAAQQAEAAPCHEPAENAALCLTHCQAGEQTLDKHQVKIPTVAPEAVSFVRPWLQPLPTIAWALREPPPAAGPPPRILFRTLLI